MKKQKETLPVICTLGKKFSIKNADTQVFYFAKSQFHQTGHYVLNPFKKPIGKILP
ncbi:MAG TPA: hypothetical protein VK168_12120 [Saprospiraceae bacterium]|nr:hypothetical protein [Saprospiraceae bacterium]